MNVFAVIYGFLVFVAFCALCVRADRLDQKYKSRGIGAHSEEFLDDHSRRHTVVWLFLYVSMFGAIYLDVRGWEVW